MKNMPEKTKASEELGIPVHELKTVSMLFLDLSSTCTGYTVAEVDFEKSLATITNTGAIWFDKHWDNQDKYHYLYRAITVYFNIIHQIDFCFAESYMINPAKKMGCLVGPEMHGSVQTALAEIDVKYKTITPQTWRSQIGVKAEIILDVNGDPKKDSRGKVTKDYKEPTKKIISKYIKLPEKIISNMSGAERNTPHDISDAIGICIGALKKLNIKNFDFKNTKVQEDFTVMMEKD